MAQDKPRFARIKGRVVPIRGGKKKPQDKKKAKPIKKSKSSPKRVSAKKSVFKGAALGLGIGGIIGLNRSVGVPSSAINFAFRKVSRVGKAGLIGTGFGAVVGAIRRKKK